MKYINLLWKWIPAIIKLFCKDEELNKAIDKTQDMKPIEMSKDVFDKKN